MPHPRLLGLSAVVARSLVDFVNFCALALCYLHYGLTRPYFLGHKLQPQLVFLVILIFYSARGCFWYPQYSLGKIAGTSAAYGLFFITTADLLRWYR